jgi:site-specific recombinase XerD
VLRLIRRHVKACPHSSSRYRRCSCPIHVYGTLGGEKIRRALDLTSWEAASDRIRGWEVSGRIGEVKTEVPALKEAIAEFLKDCRARHLSSETLRKYTTTLESRMLRWAEAHGRTTLQSWDAATVRQFRQSWNDGAIYATKNLERLRALFSFCISQKWVKDNPAKEVKAPKIEPCPVLPFTNEQMQKILEATDHYRGNKTRIKAFILAMRYSGLRISDTICLRRDALRDGKIWVRTEKTGVQVWVPVPPKVVEALEALPVDGERFFWNGNGTLKTRVANWSRYLDSVFELAGIDGAHSHRFRHTFATSLLQKGTSVENVATLLGNSPKIVSKHYAAWIRERQEILEREVMATW